MGKKTVGFQLKSEDGKVININRVQVIQAAAQKMIVNAVYNKRDYQYKDLPNNAVKDIIDGIRYDDKFRVTSLNNAQWINQLDTSVRESILAMLVYIDLTVNKRYK